MAHELVVTSERTGVGPARSDHRHRSHAMYFCVHPVFCSESDLGSLSCGGADSLPSVVEGSEFG
jgi:hypothetical protein